MSAQPVVTALSLGPTDDFAELAGRYLEEYVAKIEAAIADLDEAALWWRPVPGTNSIGNLILHLCGNLSLWIEGGVGRTVIDRDRAGEFAAVGAHEGGTHDRAALLDELGLTVASCVGTLATLEAGDLDERIQVQRYRTNMLGVVFHAVEHMSYHTGQILWAAKQILGQRPEGHGIELYPQHGGE